MNSIAVISHTYPSRHSPAQVPFIKSEVNLIAEDHHVELHIPAVYALPFQKQFYRSYRPDEDKLTVHRFRYFSFPGRRLASITQKSLSKNLIKSLSNQKPDIVHLHWLYPSGLAANALKKANFPVVLTIHGGDWYSNLANQKLMPLLKNSLEACDKIICVGKRLSKDIRDYDPNLESKITHIPHGIDTDLFSPSEGKNERRQPDWDTDKINILCVANLYHEKGIDLLVDAIFALPALDNYHLHIISPGGDKQTKIKVAQLINKHLTEDRVTFYGSQSQEQLAVLYRAADLLVSPSRKEGFGLVVAEAISCGTPVVATKSGGPNEIVDPDCGILVDADNSEKLATGLEKILMDLEKYDPQKMHRYIKTNFSISAKKEKLMAVYDDLAK